MQLESEQQQNSSKDSELAKQMTIIEDLNIKISKLAEANELLKKSAGGNPAPEVEQTLKFLREMLQESKTEIKESRTEIASLKAANEALRTENEQCELDIKMLQRRIQKQEGTTAQDDLCSEFG